MPSSPEGLSRSKQPLSGNVGAVAGLERVKEAVSLGTSLLRPALAFCLFRVVSKFLHLCQHFLFVFLRIVILTGVRWNPRIILILIFLMASDTEIFFMYF